MRYTYHGLEKVSMFWAGIFVGLGTLSWVWPLVGTSIICVWLLYYLVKQ